MNESDLAEVLQRATANLPVRDQSVAASRRAARIRRRRAVVGACSVVVLAAVAVAGAASWRTAGDVPRPAGPPTSFPTPSNPDPVRDDAEPARWDPFTLPQESRRTTVLPQRLAPPAAAPDVLDAPLPAAVLAWPQEGRDLMLLGTDGAWRSLAGTAHAVTGGLSNVVRPVLTTDGRSVAMATDAGVLVVDVVSGTQEVWPWPKPIDGPWDTPPELHWLADGDRVIVSTWPGPWVVGPGAAGPAPYRSGYGAGLMVGTDDAVVRELVSGSLLEWDGDEVVAQIGVEGSLQRPVTRYGLVAATGSDGWNRGGPVVLDAATGERVAAAFARERSSEYSDNGFLSVVGFLDRDTLLLKVAPMDFRTMDPGEETWHLVAWNFRDGGFERLAVGDSSMRAVEVAVDVVADGSS